MSASTMTNMIQTQGLSEETMMLMQKKQGIVTILGDSDTYTASASSLRRTLSADTSSKKWLSPQNNTDSSTTMIKKIASSEQLSHHHPKTIANSFSSSSSSSEGEEDEEHYEEKKKLDAEAEAEAERERLEIWSSIQRNKKEEQEKSGPFDTWGSIMSLKANNNNNNNINNTLEISKSLPMTVIPYVPPLVKRSKSSLSEKSLEICTESLGSETGSDGCLFSSSYSPSESGESEADKDKEQQQQEQEVEEEKEKVSESACEEWLLQVPRYNNHVAATAKGKSPPRSFPPPLPSLSFQANNNGSSLHMRPHRDNGRLVLQAVSLPSQNNFNAQRQDGRLVLTFTNDADDEVEENYDDDEGVEEELEEEFEGFEGFEGEEKKDKEEYEGECDDDDDESEEESEGEVEDVESVMEEAPVMSSGITTTTTTTSVHRLTLMMNNKPIGLVNRNPNWSEKFNNKGVNLEDVSVVEMEPSEAAVAQSLPPRPRVARLIPSAAAQAVASAAASSFNFNAYEYYWRTKPTAKASQVPNPLAHQQNNNSPHKNNNSNKAIVSGGDMNQICNEQQQLLVLRGKNGDYLVHNLKSCKDSRRPFLFWEPYCIPTS